MPHNLPAGILDKEIELFVDPKNTEHAYAMYDGRRYAFNEFPQFLIEIIAMSMFANGAKVEFIKKMGYKTDMAVMQKYVSCMSGAFDGEPDIVNGQMILNEFWACPNRLTCTGYGKVCNALSVGDGQPLTQQETRVLILTAHGYYYKEIAQKLGISEHTVNQHERNIRAKTGAQHKSDLVRIAYQKNLIQ